jgi:hypothetical protein
MSFEVIYPKTELGDLIEFPPPSGGKLDFDNVDEVIRQYMTRVAPEYPMSEPFLTGPLVALFLATQACCVKDEKALITRIMGHVIPTLPPEAGNKVWENLRARQVRSEMPPNFWACLFWDIECYISPARIMNDPCLQPLLTKLMAIVGIPADAAPAVFGLHLPHCFGRALLLLLVMHSLIRKSVGIETNDQLMAIIGGMGWTNMHDKERVLFRSRFVDMVDTISTPNLEDSWVTLIAASTFRRHPMIPEAFNKKAVPMLDVVYKARMAEIEKAKERAKVAMEQEKVGRAMPPLIPIDSQLPPLVPIGDKEGLPPPPPLEYHEPAASTSQVVAAPTAPAYNPYFEATDEDCAEFSAKLKEQVAIFRAAQSAGAVAKKKRLAEYYYPDKMPAAVEKLVELYRKRAGITSSHLDPTIQSMVVTLFGGNDLCWKEARTIVFGNSDPTGTNSVLIRSTFADLDFEAFSWMLRNMFILPQSYCIPQEVWEIWNMLSTLKLNTDNLPKTVEDALFMYLMIYYDPLSWKRRWIANNWTLKTEVGDAIAALLKNKPRLSATIRAYMIASGAMTL